MTEKQYQIISLPAALMAVLGWTLILPAVMANDSGDFTDDFYLKIAVWLMVLASPIGFVAMGLTWLLAADHHSQLHILRLIIALTWLVLLITTVVASDVPL